MMLPSFKVTMSAGVGASTTGSVCAWTGILRPIASALIANAYVQQYFFIWRSPPNPSLLPINGFHRQSSRAAGKTVQLNSGALAILKMGFVLWSAGSENQQR